MTMSTRQYEISGMHCGSCAMVIDWEVEDIEGVAESRTSFGGSRTVVTLDPDRVGDTEIVAAIARAGFSAVPR